MKQFAQYQRGVTAVELAVVVTLASFVMLAAASQLAPAFERQRLRSAVHDVQALAQLARAEAVERNRRCRFVVNRAPRTIEVWDGMGTAALEDDVLLHSRRLPRAVSLDRPDAGDPITFERVGSSSGFQTVFAADGTVERGSGGVYLHRADSFEAVLVVDAGGVWIRRWDGSRWQSPYAGGETNAGTRTEKRTAEP